MKVLIVSSALDTNGQNARFVRAAARYGDDPEVIKAFVVGKVDPGGVVGRFQLAAERHGGLAIRSAHKAEQYFRFPVDLVWTRQTDREVKRLAREADLLHLNNSWRPVRALGVRRPMLLHHHGSLFRRDPEVMMSRALRYKMTQAVSTLDLTRTDERLLHWLPTAYDLDELAAMRRVRDDGIIRIVSAPTNRTYKATEALIAAVDTLRAEGLPVELVLVEGVSWEECIAAKSEADILFDQVAVKGGMPDGGDYPGGYGCNAVEAWAMSIPVVAGADEWTIDRMRREFGGTLPFYAATEGTIADALRPLVQSADLRAEWGAIGRAHVERYHAERPALARLAELYALTLTHYGSTQRPRLDKAITFHNPGRRRVNDPQTLDPLVFDTEGMLSTDDPYVVAHLRTFKGRRTAGIVEVEA
jgi:hypothetical protein